MWNQIRIQLKKKQRNPLQISQISYFELYTEQVQNPHSELQQQFSEVFSLEQSQAENERFSL